MEWDEFNVGESSLVEFSFDGGEVGGGGTQVNEYVVVREPLGELKERREMAVSQPWQHQYMKYCCFLHPCTQAT